MFKIIGIVSSASILFPVFTFLTRKGYREKEFTFFNLYLLFAFFTELLLVIFLFNEKNNILFANLFAVIEGLTLLLLLWSWFQYKRVKQLTAFSIACFAAISLYSLAVESLYHLNEIIPLFERVLLSCFSAAFLVEIITRSQRSVSRNFKFWISAGIFLYFTLTFVLYTSTKFLFERGHWFISYYIYMHAFANITANILYSIAFICLPSRQARTI